MDDKIKFSDNILVQKHRGWNEYLSIFFSDVDKPWRPYEVSVSRYCVPGRVDSYAFDYALGGEGVGKRVRFFTDTGTSLLQAANMVAEDFDKPQVVEFVKTVCSDRKLQYYSIKFAENLLASIAPKSKSLKVARKCIAKNRELQKVEYAAQKQREKQNAALS